MPITNPSGAQARFGTPFVEGLSRMAPSEPKPTRFVPCRAMIPSQPCRPRSFSRHVSNRDVEAIR